MSYFSSTTNIVAFILDFKAVDNRYCTPHQPLANVSLDISNVMRNCSNDLSCAYVFKSGIDEKHYKCDATSTVKTSRSGSVLHPKGITYVS